MVIEVKRIFYRNWDEDDPKLTEVRYSTVKRDWCINLFSVISFGRCERNKDFLELRISEDEHRYFIDYDYDEFKKLYIASKLLYYAEILPEDFEQDEKLNTKKDE
jgi:hypothetical protein